MSRNPDIMNTVEYITTNKIDIPYIPDYEIEDYDFYDEKEIEKYIKDVERVVRNSFEYKRLIRFLKNKLDMRKCAIYERVCTETTDTYSKVAIHIHHEPLTLYDICKIVFKKRMELGEIVDEQVTAKEVMLLHYNLLIGLIPLAETVHELVHNQYLFIPTTKVFGFYRDFLDMYDQYIPKDIKENIQSIETATTMYDGSDLKILDTHVLYVNLDNGQRLPKYEEVQQFLNNRIKDMDKSSQSKISDNDGTIVPIQWDVIIE